MQAKSDISHAVRILPGQDLNITIRNYVNRLKIEAGWIITCVGSLTNYNIRFANQPSGTNDKGRFEIVSLTGTLSFNGNHIHICIADGTGKAIAGHLLDGCIVYTTAEIIITESGKYIFKRENDGSSPWKELQIKQI